MSKFKAYFLWFVSSSVFGAALYFGLVQDVAGAANVVQFYIWFNFILSLYMLSEKFVAEVRKKGTPQVPVWMNAVYQLCAVALLVWYGWFWAAAAYTLSAILLTRGRVPKQEKI